MTEAAPQPPEGDRRRRRRERDMDFGRYATHKVALRLAYHGHVHDGLAKQADGDNTVEGVLCGALRRLRLVPADGPADLSRCGRTDKGVSALGNVVSLTLRASATHAATHNNNNDSNDSNTNVSSSSSTATLDYATMLNHVLPPTVRVVGHALVDDDFDARFSCTRRTYRYYFAHAGLDVAAMRAAAHALVGTHDFRNLCKTDVVHVRSHVRHIVAADICASEALPHAVSCLVVTANAFLYHQIRCIMSVLLLVGRGCERVDVVRALLTRGDAKPMYGLADATPLVLWECHYDTTPVRWQLSPQALASATHELRDIATALLLRATASDAMRRQLTRWYTSSSSSSDATTSASSQQQQQDDVPASRVRVVDAWTATGCDWTHARTHEQLKARRRDLLRLARDRDKPHCFAAVRPGDNDDNDNNNNNDDDEHVVRYTPSDYVPLLERECERTYAQQVAQLGGRKRARYDANAAKASAATHVAACTHSNDDDDE